MFCKWCGADLPRSESKCPRCGREAPALSHCGGFYDLVPTAKSITPPVDPPNPPVKSDNDDSRANKQRKAAPKKKSIAPLLTCIAFLIVVVILFTLSSRLNESLALIEQQQQMLEDLTAALEQIQNDSDSATPTETNPPAEPTDSEQPTDPEQPTDSEQPTISPLGTENLEFIIGLDYENDTVTCEYTPPVDGYTFDPSRIDVYNDIFRRISILVNNLQTGFDVELTLGSLENNAFTLDAKVNPNPELFSAPDGEGEYQWYYCVPGPENSIIWKPCEQNFQGTPSYTIQSSEDRTEFKLIYTTKLADGGSFTVVICGIKIPAKHLENYSSQTNPADQTNPVQ